MEWERQEAVGQVELAEPAAGSGALDRLTDGGVGEVLVCQVVVEVARQIDDQAWFSVGTNDDVKRLNSVRTGMVVRKWCECLEGDVLDYALAYRFGFDLDAVGVRMVDGRWLAAKIQGDTMGDP